MTTLEQSIRTHPGRCQSCGYHVKTQGHGAPCIAAVKSVAIETVNNAAPTDVKARVDQAIIRIARNGREFSANDLRTELVGVPGPVVGARFNALAKQGVIVQTDRRIPSNLGSTHGHKIECWRGVAA